MPYKDPEAQRKYLRLYYEAHREREIQRSRRNADKAKARNRVLLDALKSENPCTDCGQHYPPYVMEFDHLDAATKSHEVSNMLTFSWQRILLEIGKCELVCANCHRIRTFTRMSEAQ